MKALKKLNKKTNTIHFTVLDTNTEHMFSVYDSKMNQLFSDVVSMDDINTIIPTWVGGLKINNNFYEKK